MHQIATNQVTQSLTTVDRRTSLKALALGIAALGITPVTSSASKDKSKGKKNRGKKACQRQVAACVTTLQGICDPADSNCLSAVNDSCAPLGVCDAATATQRVVDFFIV